MGYQSLGLCWDGLWSGPIINTLPGFFQKYRPASVVATKKSCTSTIQSQAEGTKDMNTQLHFKMKVLIQVKPCWFCKNLR